MKNVLLAAFLCVWIWPFSTYAQTNTFSTLVVFDGTNGTYPLACLIQGSDGNFFGTTCQGGVNNQGTVFKMTPNGMLQTLFAFNGNNGVSPVAPLIQGNDGNIYGTTCSGGTNDGDGTVFRITPNGVFTCLVSFAGTNGANVLAGLVQGTDGNFYGTTINGGINPGPPPTSSRNGTVFKITPDGTLTTLYSFYSGFTGIYGLLPNAGLVEGKDGNFYGTTEFTTTVGYDYGTIFKINTNGVLNTLFIFNKTYGTEPIGPLVLGSDGSFYGRTISGGTNNLGTVFRFATNGTFTRLVSFNGTNGSNHNFLAPAPGALVLATDGNFYGTTPSGGESNKGTIFMMTPNGTLTTVYSFIGGTNGANPTGLIQASDGNFYGTTTLTSETVNGGGIGDGTIFRISIPLQPVFQSVAQANDTLTLVWKSVASQTYQLQYTTDLTSTNWTDLGGINTATNGTILATDIIGSDTQRFYRVVLLQ